MNTVTTRDRYKPWWKINHIEHCVGVGLYFKKGVRFNILQEKCIFVERIFESLFAEVWLPSTNKKIIVGSVYRPNTTHPTLPSSEQFLQFFDLLTNLLDDFSNLNTPVMLMGDLNLDALKYGIIKMLLNILTSCFRMDFSN